MKAKPEKCYTLHCHNSTFSQNVFCYLFVLMIFIQNQGDTSDWDSEESQCNMYGEALSRKTTGHDHSDNMGFEQNDDDNHCDDPSIGESDNPVFASGECTHHASGGGTPLDQPSDASGEGTSHNQANDASGGSNHHFLPKGIPWDQIGTHPG